VALRYADAFRAARRQPGRRHRRRVPADSAAPEPAVRRLPPVNLDHLRRLTDSTGIIQHAVYDLPNLAEGYCTDDNARALTLMVMLEDLGLQSPASNRAAAVYAAFLDHAFDADTGRFRNFLGFDRRWLDEAAASSDDCLGRTVVALGTCIGRSRTASLQRWAIRFFEPEEIRELVRPCLRPADRLSIEKFGGPADYGYGIQRRLPGIGAAAASLPPRLYRFQPWSMTERIAVVIDLGARR
jgi:hypothetical protein